MKDPVRLSQQLSTILRYQHACPAGRAKAPYSAKALAPYGNHRRRRYPTSRLAVATGFRRSRAFELGHDCRDKRYRPQRRPPEAIRPPRRQAGHVPAQAATIRL